MEPVKSPIALAMTGASGAAYGLRLLECLLRADREVYLMLTKPAHVVISMETDLVVPGRAADAQRYLSEYFNASEGQLHVFGRDQWTAPVASGTHPPESMVICPCTTGTLASIASGMCRDLMDRAADVILKERRKLIVVVRETPFSDIHLKNMLTLSNMGAVIMPANPGFYFKPAEISELIDFMVARVLDHLEIPHELLPRWGD